MFSLYLRCIHKTLRFDEEIEEHPQNLEFRSNNNFLSTPPERTTTPIVTSSIQTSISSKNYIHAFIELGPYQQVVASCSLQNLLKRWKKISPFATPLNNINICANKQNFVVSNTLNNNPTKQKKQNHEYLNQITLNLEIKLTPFAIY